MTEAIRLGARLRAARKAAGFKTSKSFLKKYKYPASTYSQHESGARQPDDDTLAFYSKTFDVNLNWLKSGNGSPYKQISVSKKTILNEELLDISDTKKIDTKLLTNIIEKIFKLEDLAITATKCKNIANKIAKFYQKNYLIVEKSEK